MLGPSVLTMLQPLLPAGNRSYSGDNSHHLSGLDHLLDDPTLSADPLHMDWARHDAAVHVPGRLCAVLCDQHLCYAAAVGCLPKGL